MKILDKIQDHQDSREEIAQKYIKDSCVSLKICNNLIKNRKAKFHPPAHTFELY